MKRNIGLDLLKVIACFSVIVLHVAGIIANVPANYTINCALYYTAVLSVPIFFMVNGCLLLNKPKLNYRYTIKKTINILLVIFLWNVLLFLSKFIIRGSLSNPFYSSLENLIQRDYFWQFWFFGALILIYLVLPIINKIFNSNIKNAILITAFFIVISIGIDLTSLMRSITGLSIVQIHVIQTFRLWTWFAYYLLGGLIGKKEIKIYVLQKVSNKTNLIVVAIMTIVINVYQFNVAHYIYKNTYAEFFYDNIFTFIWIISLFVLVYRQNYLKYKGKKIIELISNNAMGIYIIHVTIIKFMEHFYKFNTPITNICLIIIVFICSLIGSEIISKIPLVNKLIKI